MENIKFVDEIDEFIKKVRELENYKKAYYFIKCLKLNADDEMIECPNFFFRVPINQTYRLFIHFDKENIPIIFQMLIADAGKLIKNFTFTIKDLYELYKADSNHNYESFVLIKSQNDLDCILYAFLIKIIEEDSYKISSIEEIRKIQNLIDANRYGLTKIDINKCYSRTFLYEGNCYHYSLFFNLTRKDQFQLTPRIIDIFKLISDADVYLICDKNLLCKQGQFSSTTHFELYRGINNFEFPHIEKLVTNKQIIVHFDPDGKYEGNKLLLVLKPDYENDTRFYHVIVEALWNPTEIVGENITVGYIHAKYFSKDKCFKHMDYSVNEYTLDHYLYKYEDAVNETNTPIDCIADRHHKVWCIENGEISIDNWQRLVYSSIDAPFRHLFLEIINEEYNQ